MQLMKSIQFYIQVNSELYLKNPDSSELGHRIISESVVMINELGFESYTFKKLGVKIESPESSIYRYFENKHTLLIYLVSWYWSWIEYLLVFKTANLSSPIEKLKQSIGIVTQPLIDNYQTSFVDVKILSTIIITESVKAYHTKNVDEENKKGYFKTYKKVVQRISDLVLEVNPKFEYPHMLISTVIEGAHQQGYFAEHLPGLTDVNNGKNAILKFYTKMVLEVIK